MYKAEKYIRDAIDSVLNQTFEDFELIVIDDCSPDTSFKIAKNLAEQDSRVIILRNERNMGVCATRNKGISAAKGEWIAFLDSDDAWKANKLAEQLALAESKNASFIYTGATYISDAGELLRHQYEPPSQVSLNELKRHNVVICSSVLVKRSTLDNLTFSGEELREDFLMWLRVLGNGYTAYGIPAPLVYYRIAIGSRSSNKVKMIKQTYGVFRALGLNPIISSFYTLSHFYFAYNTKHRVLRKVSREMS